MKWTLKKELIMSQVKSCLAVLEKFGWNTIAEV